MNQKQNIIDFLEDAYIGAKVMNDVEMMLRLSRAIVSFSYDNLEENNPDWDKMLDEYINKNEV